MPNGAPASTPTDALRVAGGVLMLARAMDSMVRGSAGEGALSVNDLGVLGQIDRGTDLPSQIARAMRLDPARVTHISDRLVGLGYIVREMDAQDRRRWRLRLTDEGRRRLAEGRESLAAVMERLLAGLSPEERAALTLGLDGVRRSLAEQQP
jgi:DNA-binding MarR family transcriptional regulator